MKLKDLVDCLQTIAPTHLAEPWDNVGLLAGDPQQVLARAMLCIDYTREVAEEARAAQCDAVIAYHPPIFDPVKRVTAPGLIYDAIRRGVALYSPHTALDVADGGTNDMLADAIGLRERQPLRVAASHPMQYKLVTFVPAEALEKVSGALFEAGAGRIGEYAECSFRSEGTGTFFGRDGTNPAVGKAGRRESAPEIRLETVVSIRDTEKVLTALRTAHPYEEPAFDLVQLAAPPRAIGQGRIGTMPPVQRDDVFSRIKRALGTDRLLIAGPREGAITSAAACAGACGKMLDDALSRGVELYLTGEMRHHDALRAAEAGLTVVCALHSVSERAVLARVAERLRRDLPALQVQLSQRDRDPFYIH